jgi:putative membrane protein
MQIIHFSQQMQGSPFSGGFHAAAMRGLVTGIAVFLAVAIVPGIEADTLGAGVAAVFVLTILNFLLRPILLVLAFPLILLTLGLFLVVLNALLLELTAYLVKGFTVSGFWPAVGGAIVISAVSSLLNFLAADRNPIDVWRVEPHKPRSRQPKIINPSE